MRIDNAQFTGSATGTQATATLSGSFSGSHEGSGLRLTQVTASKLLFSASFGLGIENTFNFDAQSNQQISIDTSSAHFIIGARSASNANTASLLTTASLSGLTQSFTKGDGSTFEIYLPDTSSATQTDTGSFIVSASLSSLTASGLFTMSFTNKKNETINVNLSASEYSLTASRVLGTLTEGQGVDTFTYNGATTTTVGIGTFSASIDTKVNTNSSSIATTVNNVSSSLSASIADIIDGTTTIASSSYAVTSSHAITASYFKGNADNVSINNSSITGSTISGSTIDGSTITNTTASSIQATGSFQGNLDGTASFASKVENALSNGTLVDAFTYDGSATATVDITTYSGSASTERVAIAARVSGSSVAPIAALSASTSTARSAIATAYIAADTALSSSANLARRNYYQSSSITPAREEDSFRLVKGDGTVDTLVFSTASFVKSVNTLTPDAAGNVAVAIASVSTGLSSSFPATPNEGDVYIVSGETGALTGSNGQAWIYESGTAQWYQISSLDQVESDIRYVQVAGDTMTGNLVLPAADPTLANQATRKGYVDLFYDSSSLLESTSQLSLHKGDGTIDVIALAGITTSGSVSSSYLSQADGVRIESTTGRTENYIELKTAANALELAARDNIILNMDTNGGGVGTIDFQLNGTSVANIDQDGTGSFAWVDATASVANSTRHSLTTASADAGIIGFLFDGNSPQTLKIDTGSAIFQNAINAATASLSASVANTYVSQQPGQSISGSSITGSVISGSTIEGGTISGSTINGGSVTGDVTLNGTLSGGVAKLSGSFTGSFSGSVTSAKTYDASVETADFNFVQGTLHVVSTAITGTLPATPNVGDRVAFMNLSTVEPLIARNGSNIMSSATDLSIDSQYASFQLIYTAATEGWILVGANN